MSIQFFPETKTFRLDTKETSYIMSVSRQGHLLHLYYGGKLGDDDISVLTAGEIRTGFSPLPYEYADGRYSLDCMPQEFSTDGVGDFRYTSISVVNSDGSYAFDGKYVKHRIYSGKYSLDCLPSLFSNPDEKRQIRWRLSLPIRLQASE